MKIKEIQKGFSKKVQVERFEPIEAFCFLTAECNEDEVEEASKTLRRLCVTEVERDIRIYIDKRSKNEFSEEATDEAEHDVSFDVDFKEL